MWLLIAAGMLQVLLITERILYRLLFLLVPLFYGHDDRAAVKHYADNSVVGSLFASITYVMLTPLNFLVAAVSMLLQNGWVLAFVLLLSGFLLIVSENFPRTMVLYVNTYNSGYIGLYFDLKIWLLELLDWFIGLLLPLYNSSVWLLQQIVLQVFLPLLGNENVFAVIPELLKNLSLGIGAFAVSVSTYTNNILFCASGADHRGASTYGFSPNNTTQSMPFTDGDLQCVGNHAFYTHDLMTPGFFLQQAVTNVQGVLVLTCSPIAFLVEFALYPLTDFNLYKAVHCMWNFVLSTVVTLPLMTVKRCRYAQKNSDYFFPEEVAVMCVPDFGPWVSTLNEGLRAGGRLVDNWLDVGLAMVERVQGKNQDLCSRARKPGAVVADGSAFFGAPESLLKYVQLTEALSAVTDGQSTLYYTHTDSTFSEMAIGNWPFAVEPAWGVAAVRAGGTEDADVQADPRTGLFGCQCVDEVVPDSKHTRLRVLCAAVPYVGFHDNETAYNASTVHEILFVDDHVRTLMQCSNTLIRVHPLRFSRKRFADARTPAPLNDLFDTQRVYGNLPPVAHTADAAVYIQPRCSDGPGFGACFDTLDTCFPFCLGLHLAGQSGANITAHNAKRWDGFVTFAQMECVGGFADFEADCDGLGVSSQELGESSFGVREQAVCDLQACSADASSTTALEVARLAEGAQLAGALRNREDARYAGWVRLQAQPFVVAGDVMLRVVPGEDGRRLRITRLFDHNQGQFSLQHEQLGLLHGEGARVLDATTECMTLDDAECYNAAVAAGQLVLPPSYFSSNRLTYVPAAASEWAVHWGVNPENAVYESRIKRCQGVAMDDVTVPASYGTPRVWTLLTMQAAAFDAAPTAPRPEVGISFMTIPNWFDATTEFGPGDRCHVMFGMRITDLEYIDEQNVLVTVLTTTMQNYDVATHTGRDPALVRYTRYFLHPTRRDCVDPGDSYERAIFSCFRHESAGPFTSGFIARNNQLLGTFCPAMRRMPQLGSGAAEVLVANVYTAKMALDAISVLPVAWIDTVYDLSRTEPTFHSVLYGDFLVVDNIVDSLARAAMHIAHTLPRLGRFLQGVPGYTELQPRLIGTAKLLQHNDDLVRLQGAFLGQLSSVKAVPIAETMDRGKSFLTAASSPTGDVARSTTKAASTGSSTLRLNMRLLREFILKSLRASAKRIGSTAKRALQQGRTALSNSARMLQRTSKLSGNAGILAGASVLRTAKIATFAALMSTTLFEAQDDIRRYLLDVLRVQCQGLGEVVGDNPFGRATRHMCLLVPDGIEGVLRALLVLAIDYPLMDCVCRQTREMDAQSIVVDRCMPQLYPIASRTYMINYLRAPTLAVGTCFAYMDEANQRFMDAFGPVQQRMHRAGDSLADALDYLLFFIPGYEAGECRNYDASAYVMALLPEPASYFMGCMHTYDCRTRCFDGITAFEQALAGLDVPPVFEDEVDVDVDSRFFSDADVEAGRDRLPFPAYGMAELGRASCSALCAGEQQDRCLVLLGIENSTRVAARYYCVPRSFTRSVYDANPVFAVPYHSEWGGSGDSKVVNMWALTTDAFPARETLLVSVLNTTSTTTALWVYTPTGERFVLVETGVFDPEDTVSTQPTLQEVVNVRVRPRGAWDGQVAVYVTGTRNFMRYEDEVAVLDSVEVCLLYTMTSDGLADFGLAVFETGCVPALQSPDTHKIVVVDAAGREVWIPLDGTADKLRLYGNADETFTEFTALDALQTLKVDPAIALVLTQEDMAVPNRKYMADVSETAYTETVGGTVTLNLLLVGSVDDVQSWINNLRIELDPNAKTYTSDVRASERVQQTVQLQAACALDNCAACQTKEHQLRYHDVQMKCYAAAECAIARCVGTLVNMRKPLCNLGSLLVRRQMDTARIALGAMWAALAQSTILVVELTQERRQRYELSSYQEYFTALTCSTKDSIVSGAATVTSIVGAVTSAVHGLRADDLDPQSHIIDANTNGRIVLGLASMTNFLSSVAMAVIFPLVLWNKILQCQADSALAIFTNLLGDSTGVRIEVSLTKDSLEKASASAVGVCLSDFSKEFMRDLSDSKGKHKIASIISNLITDIGFFMSNQFFSPYWHVAEAFLIYLYGVVTAMMDVVQTLDWNNCKLPVTAFARVDKCACNDVQVVIPSTRKTNSVRSEDAPTASLWCSGFMLLTAADGKDFLIWNPYSLEDLLHPKYDTTLFVGLGLEDILDKVFDSYVACLATVDARDCVEPVLPDLEAQGVNALQVITRCRTNFQQARWDPASVLYGLLPLEVWRDPATLLTTAAFDDVAATDAIVRRLLQLRVYMQRNSNFLDEETHECLVRANALELVSHECADGYYRRSLYGSTAAYFQYRKSDSTRFVDRDACEVFTGLVQQPTGTGALYPFTLWRSSSRNKVPLAKLHNVEVGGTAERDRLAQSELDAVVQDSQQFFAENPFLAEQAGELRIEYSAWEGDSLHQMVDCVVLGPYAAADMQTSFRLPSGLRLPVAQYHRGSPQSRAFPLTDETGGSEVRRKLVAAAFAVVKDAYESQIDDIVFETYNRLKAKFKNVQNMYCICADNSRSLACCREARHETELRFDLARELERTYDIYPNLQQAGMEALFREDVFREDLWANDAFTFHVAHEFSEDEREELSIMHLFDPKFRVGTYSSSEALVNSTDETLWSRCMSLLATPFFTLPLRAGEATARAHAETHYDPMHPPPESREAFLHGMEHAIAAILERAREHSPVFWTHPHRYVPSESVWCESDTVHTTPVRKLDFSGELHGEQFSLRGLEAPGVSGVRYPTTLACACELAADGECVVPPQLCASAPTLSVCPTGRYSTREDLFVVLKAMQTHGVVCESAPSVTWGLLNRDEHADWFWGSEPSADSVVSLHDVAVFGPGGVRLGMLKDEGEDSLHTHSNLSNVGKRSSAYPMHNHRYQHTVGQPACTNTPSKSLPRDFTQSDLRQYLRDTLFPVAHSVFVAPAGAECSTWVVEYALWQVLHYTHGEVAASTLEQHAREERARGRCLVQLQQIGLCNLRGVFDIAPAGSGVVPAHCPFTISPAHTCTDLFYVTQSCIVMCNGELHDPCLCAESTCQGHEFVPDPACVLPMDPRAFATHPELLLYSMHWPEQVAEDEAGEQDPVELQALLDVVRQRLASSEYDLQQLHDSIAHLVVQHDNDKAEGTLHEACGDMLDYFDGSEQHPVGYHPTRPCALNESVLRGFDAWMSVPVDPETGEADGYLVDPIRLRNMTLASRVFGTGHLLCDASAYGALGHELNPYTLETRWNADRRTDPALPLDLTQDQVEGMRTVGTPGDSGSDTPCADVFSPMLAHSVGLVRDWLRLYGPDRELQAAYDALWPHWGDAFDPPCDYGLSTAAPVQTGCPHPPLFQCSTNADCTTTAGEDLVCLMGEQDGVCARSGSCFRHEHCSDNRLCSGEGECVEARIFIEHSGDQAQDIAVQLFSLARTEACNDTMRGTSAHHLVPTFAEGHGLCSARNWFVFREELAAAQRSVYESAHVRSLADFPLQRPEDEDGPQSIFERQLLHVHPHACDRDFHQADVRLCPPGPVRAFAGMQEAPRPSDRAIERVLGIRTWTDGPDGTQLHRCHLSEATFRRTTGFLHPYAPPAGDTLATVRDELAPCTRFRVCQQFRFLVDGAEVEHRRVALARWDSATGNVEIEPTRFRDFAAADADACWGMGYTVGTMAGETALCVVDRFAAPLLYVLADRVGEPNVASNVSLALGPLNRQARFDSIRAHCPQAFSRSVDADGLVGLELFEWLLATLPTHYFERDRNRIALYLNQLPLVFFGIATNDLGRGFDSLEGYLKHSRCARFLSRELLAVQEGLRPLDVYRQDSLAPEQVPGASLYLFHEFAPLAVAPRWFWKCVVLARPQEGGAPAQWFARVTDPAITVLADGLACPVFDARPSAAPVTVRRLLQTSDIFALSETEQGDILDNTQQPASALADAVRSAVAAALDKLGLTQSPQMHCMQAQRADGSPIERPFEDSSCSEHLGQDTCWHKTCAERCDNEGFDEEYNLYSEALQAVFGTTSWLQARITNYNELEQAGHITIDLDLEHTVAGTSRFVPFVRLNTLAAANVQADPAAVPTYGLFQNEVPVTYATPDNSSAACAFRLNVPEYEALEGNGPFTGPLFRNINALRYLTFDKARFELLRHLQNSIHDHFTDVDRLHVSPGAHLFDTQAGTATAADQAARLAAAFAYSKGMREKTYPCGNVDNFRLELETNHIPSQLRACARELKRPIGWRVPHGTVLQVRPGAGALLAGFFPAFTPTPNDPSFLDNMLDEDWKLHTSMDRAVCFQRQDGSVAALNPLWAGDYDTTSCPGAACGCDTYVEPGEGRVVDTRCAGDCNRSFPAFHRLTQDRMPAECLALGLEHTPVVLRRGSLLASYTPLCDLADDIGEFAEGCDNADSFGALSGWTGEPAASLYARGGAPTPMPGGLFSASNSIFRSRSFRPASLPVLRLLPSDIGGSALHFALERDANLDQVLQLQCAMLSSSPASKCTAGERRWLADVEDRWLWQHNRLDTVWPAPAPGAAPWTCPLQWLSAYSGTTRDHAFAARVPSRERNRVRFAHITGASHFAHPTVQSVSTLAHLRPARYKADHLMCAETRKDCTGGLSDVIEQLKTRTWALVDVTPGDDTCTQILDWPEQTFRLRDQTAATQRAAEPCFALDRLPRFAIRQRYAGPRDPTPDTSPAMLPGGACHMGSLRRFRRQAWPHHHLQMCTDEPQLRALRCLFTVKNASSNAFSRTREYVAEADPPVAQPTHRRAADLPRRRCSTCDAVHAHVLDPMLTEHTLADAPAQLSVGQPVRVSTERLLAAYLRRKLCPNATDAVCADLRDLFDSTAWQRGEFLPRMLDANRYHELFTAFDKKRLPPPSNTSHFAEAADAVLWGRPWVFCDQSNQSVGCAGSIPRETWLDPRQRVSQCAIAISEHQAHAPQVRFCHLNAQTAKLCEQIVAWNTRIGKALCTAAGLCATDAFFYNPAAYSIDNQDFVAVSVHDFYVALDTGAQCSSLTTHLATEQVESNRQALGRCGSIYLEVLRKLIDIARGVLHILFKVVYYALMAVAQLVQIFIAAVTDVADRSSLLGEAVARLMRYIKLFLDTIREFWKYIINAFWKLLTELDGNFGKVLYDIVRFLCTIVAFLQEVICELLKILNTVYTETLKALHKIRDWNFKVLTERVYLGRSLDFFTRPMIAMIDKIILPLHDQLHKKMCKPLNCTFEYPSEVGNTDGTLPVATRCWTTHSAVFGEQGGLACTAADTCRVSHMDSSLKVCAQCPASTTPLIAAFECDPLLKMCSCGVPQTTRTFCSSNTECADPLATCAYVDTDLEIGTGTVECAACSTQRMCFLAPGATAGVCACALFKTPYSSCTTQAEIVLPSPDAFCLLAPGSQFAASAQYTAAWSTALTAPCRSLDPTAVYCARILDATGSNALYAVGTRTSAVLPGPTRRRLLGFAEAMEVSKEAFESMMDIHNEYASQIVTAFDYEYANLYTDSTAVGWVAQWPPDPALAAEAAQTCGPFWNLIQILAQAGGNASLPYTNTGRRMKGEPGTSLSAAWPRVPRQHNVTWDDSGSVRAGDAVVRTWVWFIRRALAAVGLTKDNVYDVLKALLNEARNAVECDLEAVQTCKNWKVLLLHSVIVNAVFFSAWFLVANGARLSFLASLSVVLFIPSVLYLSYGYSPFCAPMIPTCLLEDAVRSLRLVFPRFMRVPRAFVRDKSILGQPCLLLLEASDCSLVDLPLSSGVKCTDKERRNREAVSRFLEETGTACIRDCDEPPLEFTSWRAVFAWVVAELGQGAVDWVLDVQGHIPLLDHHDMQAQLLLKNGVWRLGDPSLVTAHRVCATVHSYLLAPYLLLVLLLATAAVATVLVVLIPALIPLLGTIAQLYAAIFVQRDPATTPRE